MELPRPEPRITLPKRWWALAIGFCPVILCTGSFLNWRFNRRLPLIAAWLPWFVAQALLRHRLFGARLESALLPMTGVAFILYGDRPRHHTFWHACTAYLRRRGGRRVWITHGASHRFRFVLRINYRVRGPRARRGNSGLETKRVHAASNALCAIKRETRLADRAAGRKALPEPAVAVAQ
jgi:hypothetical protein